MILTSFLKNLFIIFYLFVNLCLYPIIIIILMIKGLLKYVEKSEEITLFKN